MPVERVSRSFKDISLSFKPHPVTKDVIPLKNANAISRSVKNLVMTQLQERPFAPDLGSRISGSLFELMDAGSASIIADEIRNTIDNYEPRVTNVGVQVNANPDGNEFEVSVFFEIVGLDAPVQSFTFILEPTR